MMEKLSEFSPKREDSESSSSCMSLPDQDAITEASFSDWSTTSAVTWMDGKDDGNDPTFDDLAGVYGPIIRAVQEWSHGICQPHDVMEARRAGAARLARGRCQGKIEKCNTAIDKFRGIAEDTIDDCLSGTLLDRIYRFFTPPPGRMGERHRTGDTEIATKRQTRNLAEANFPQAHLSLVNAVFTPWMRDHSSSAATKTLLLSFGERFAQACPAKAPGEKCTWDFNTMPVGIHGFSLDVSSEELRTTPLNVIVVHAPAFDGHRSVYAYRGSVSLRDCLSRQTLLQGEQQTLQFPIVHTEDAATQGTLTLCISLKVGYFGSGFIGFKEERAFTAPDTQAVLSPTLSETMLSDVTDTRSVHMIASPSLTGRKFRPYSLAKGSAGRDDPRRENRDGISNSSGGGDGRSMAAMDPWVAPISGKIFSDYHENNDDDLSAFNAICDRWEGESQVDDEDEDEQSSGSMPDPATFIDENFTTSHPLHMTKSTSQGSLLLMAMPPPRPTNDATEDEAQQTTAPPSQQQQQQPISAVTAQPKLADAVGGECSKELSPLEQKRRRSLTRTTTSASRGNEVEATGEPGVAIDSKEKVNSMIADLDVTQAPQDASKGQRMAAEGPVQPISPGRDPRVGLVESWQEGLRLDREGREAQDKVWPHLLRGEERQQALQRSEERHEALSASPPPQQSAVSRAQEAETGNDISAESSSKNANPMITDDSSQNAALVLMRNDRLKERNAGRVVTSLLGQEAVVRGHADHLLPLMEQVNADAAAAASLRKEQRLLDAQAATPRGKELQHFCTAAQLLALMASSAFQDLGSPVNLSQSQSLQLEAACEGDPSYLLGWQLEVFHKSKDCMSMGLFVVGAVHKNFMGKVRYLCLPSGEEAERWLVLRRGKFPGKRFIAKRVVVPFNSK